MHFIDPSVFLGRKQSRSLRFLIFAAGICVVVIAVLTIDSISALHFTWYEGEFRRVLLYGIGTLALGGAIVNAYLNDGLLVSIAIMLAISLGYGVATIILSSLDMLVTDSPPELLFVYFAVYSALIGAGAFVFGVGVRTIINHINI